jgi:hypothetical protein
MNRSTDTQKDKKGEKDLKDKRYSGKKDRHTDTNQIGDRQRRKRHTD